MFQNSSFHQSLMFVTLIPLFLTAKQHIFFCSSSIVMVLHLQVRELYHSTPHLKVRCGFYYHYQYLSTHLHSSALICKICIYDKSHIEPGVILCTTNTFKKTFKSLDIRSVPWDLNNVLFLIVTIKAHDFDLSQQKMIWDDYHYIIKMSISNLTLKA